MSVTVNEIKAALVSGQFTNEDLDQIVQAFKFARSQVARKTRSTLRIGISVKFISSRTGTEVVGKVKKIGPKNVQVDVSGMTWRVPAGMLSAA